MRTTEAMGFLALGEDPVGQWWSTYSSKWRILVMGISNSANFSNSKRHIVTLKRITQAKLSHLTGRQMKHSFKRNRAYMSCRKLSHLHNKPLGTEARHRPAAMDHMMPSVTWTSFAEKISHEPFRQLLSRLAVVALVKVFCLSSPFCSFMYS